MTDIRVTEKGFIVLGDERLTSREAIDHAIALVESVRLSRDRNQVETANYYDSKHIIERQESPLGRALDALRKVF